TNVIAGFAPSDTIVLANTEFSSLNSAVFIEAQDKCSIVGASSPVSLNLQGQFFDAVLRQSPSGGTEITEVSSPVDTAQYVKLWLENYQKVTKLVGSIIFDDKRSFDKFKGVFDPIFNVLGTAAAANLIYTKAQQTFNDPSASDAQI